MHSGMIFVFALSVFHLAVNFTRGENRVVGNLSDLNTVLETVFKCHKNPGVSIALVKNGTVLFTGGYGVTDLQRNTNVTSNTLFNVASVTKNMAAALFIKLLSENTNLTVNSKVKDLLGDEFQLLDDIRAREMTLADVLGHRTGVPPNNIIRFDNTLSRKNLLQHLAKLKTPDQFRVKYYYNNLMYGLVTYMIEVLGNSSFENLVTEHFLTPLGMNNTTFVTKVNFTREDVAWPYVEDNGTLVQVPFEHLRRWGLLAGSVSLVTSAEDMVKWMNFHLSNGKDSKGRVVMEEQFLNELHIPRMALPTPATANFKQPNVPHTFSTDTYTFGLRNGYYRGYQTLSHSGSNHGFRALLLLLPTEGVGAFIAMSGTDDSNQYRTPVHMYLVDRALGLNPWLNASTLCSYPAPWRSVSKPILSSPGNRNTSLKFPSQDYEGVYENEAYGKVEVTAYTASDLYLSYGWATWHLLPSDDTSSNKNLFYAEGVNLTIAYNLDPIEFIRESSGFVKIKATGFEPAAPPVFTRSNKAGNDNKNWLQNVCLFLFLLSFVHLVK